MYVLLFTSSRKRNLTVARVCYLVAGMFGVSRAGPADLFTHGVSELGLIKSNGDAVPALRANLCCKLVTIFSLRHKLQCDKFTSLGAVRVLNAVDGPFILAAADADSKHEQRFIDYLNSKEDILPFDLCVRPHLPDTLPSSFTACVIIDLFARVENSIAMLYQCAFELMGRQKFQPTFPSPLR